MTSFVNVPESPLVNVGPETYQAIQFIMNKYNFPDGSVKLELATDIMHH